MEIQPQLSQLPSQEPYINQTIQTQIPSTEPQEPNQLSLDEPQEPEQDLRNFTSGRWNPDEHTRFLKGCLRYGNNWKKVESYVKSRTSSQIRSHAQKFLIRLNKKYKDKLDSSPTSSGSLTQKNIKIPKIKINHETREELISSLDLPNCDLERVEITILRIFNNNIDENNSTSNIIENCEHKEPQFKPKLPKPIILENNKQPITNNNFTFTNLSNNINNNNNGKIFNCKKISKESSIEKGIERKLNSIELSDLEDLIHIVQSDNTKLSNIINESCNAFLEKVTQCNPPIINKYSTQQQIRNNYYQHQMQYYYQNFYP